MFQIEDNDLMNDMYPTLSSLLIFDIPMKKERTRSSSIKATTYLE